MRASLGKPPMSTAHDDAVDRAGAPTEALALPTVEPTKALLAKMFETIENIGKAEDHLQRKIDAELATADKFDAAGEKREALQCLKKRAMYMQQLATLKTSKIDLESQKMTMESIQRVAAILDARRMAAKSIQEQIKQMGGVDKVDKVEELMEYEVEDVRTRGVSILSELISGIISGLISELIMLDGELQCLETKEMYEHRLRTLWYSKNMILEYQNMMILDKQAVLEHELNDFAALREAKKAMQKQGQDLQARVAALRSEAAQLVRLSKETGDDTLKAQAAAKLRESKLLQAQIDQQGAGAGAGAGAVVGSSLLGGADKVEELMDELEDLRTPTSDLMLHGIDADNYELLAEMDELLAVMEEEMAADSSKQKRGGKAGFLEQLRKRIMGVARPMMRLRQVIPLKMGACWSVAPNKAAPQPPAQDSSMAAMVDEELVMIARNPAKEAMAKLKETIENIGKKEDHLQRMIDAELATAKKFKAAGKTREALQCIQKKKMYEQQLATLGTSKMNLENLKLTMESMFMNADCLDAHRAAGEALWKDVVSHTAVTLQQPVSMAGALEPSYYESVGLTPVGPVSWRVGPPGAASRSRRYEAGRRITKPT